MRARLRAAGCLTEWTCGDFRTHHEADTQEHDSGAAHGTVNARIVEACLIDGYRPERPGYTLESAATLSVDLSMGSRCGISRT